VSDAPDPCLILARIAESENQPNEIEPLRPNRNAGDDSVTEKPRPKTWRFDDPVVASLSNSILDEDGQS